MSVLPTAETSRKVTFLAVLEHFRRILAASNPVYSCSYYSPTKGSLRLDGVSAMNKGIGMNKKLVTLIIEVELDDELFQHPQGLPLVFFEVQTIQICSSLL